MSSAVFELNGTKITIQCTNNQIMKEIIQNFGSKAEINVANYIFMYNGTIVNKELSFENIANNVDKQRKQINILVYEIRDENNLEESMKLDLNQKGIEILRTHLNGRKYIEPKVYEWIQKILEDFENYFYQKYSSTHDLFSFCLVCSKSTFFLEYQNSCCEVDMEGDVSLVFQTEDLFSQLKFFYYKKFTSIPCPFLEPKITCFGNKLLYENFDEKKFGTNLNECCLSFSNDMIDNILTMTKTKRCLNIIMPFQKPVKNFSYNYKIKKSYDLSKIIQTFVTTEIEVWNFLFIISNDK